MGDLEGLLNKSTRKSTMVGKKIKPQELRSQLTNYGIAVDTNLSYLEKIASSLGVEINSAPKVAKDMLIYIIAPWKCAWLP